MGKMTSLPRSGTGATNRSALERFRTAAKATTTLMDLWSFLMDWFLFQQGDETDTPSEDCVLRFSQAIEEGIPPAEIFLRTSDLFSNALVCIPNQGPDGVTCNISDTSLWRVDREGLYLRLSKEDSGLLFGFGSFSLVLNPAGMVRIDIDPNAAYTKLTPMTLSPDSLSRSTTATTLQVLRRVVIFSNEIAI